MATISKSQEWEIRNSQAKAEKLADRVGGFCKTSTSGDTTLTDWIREGAEGNGLEGRTPQELAEEWDGLS